MVSDWIDEVIKRAADLRAAGVTRIKIGDMEADIGDAVPSADLEYEEPEQLASGDPLDDPMTYGGILPSIHPGAES